MNKKSEEHDKKDELSRKKKDEELKKIDILPEIAVELYSIKQLEKIQEQQSKTATEII